MCSVHLQPDSQHGCTRTQNNNKKAHSEYLEWKSAELTNLNSLACRCFLCYWIILCLVRWHLLPSLSFDLFIHTGQSKLAMHANCSSMKTLSVLLCFHHSHCPQHRGTAVSDGAQAWSSAARAHELNSVWTLMCSLPALSMSWWLCFD